MQATAKILLCSAIALGFAPAGAVADQPPTAAAAQARADGSHDFDFNIGTWHTHIRTLKEPLSGRSEWNEMRGTVTVNPIWNGKAQVEEIEADSAGGRFEGMTVFLYDPAARQWRQYFTNSDSGVMEAPSVGHFERNRGEFYSQELYKGRAVLVRGIWTITSPDTHSYEQDYSDDGGKTWEANFIADLTRYKPGEAVTPMKPVGNAAGQHDFDWQLGNWDIHMSRLEHPLAGSTRWTPLDGTVRVRKLWNGRANLAEIDTQGPSGHLQFLSLRLFNPVAHQWSLNFVSSGNGKFSSPMIGAFVDGRGDFYDQEPYNGKAILARFSFLNLAKGSNGDEQAFSADGGKTWEVNWVNASKRAADAGKVAVASHSP
ncbi:hypothetical protein [Dyella sp.]|uniref:hypothetical protein n=1 Tax=Dyella sp. TaxID=1869338 RepID=UPI003217FB4B